MSLAHMIRRRAIPFAVAAACLAPAASRAQGVVQSTTDTSATRADSVEEAPIIVDFGGEIGRVVVHSLETTVTGVGGGRRHATTTQIRLTRRPDSSSAALALKLSSGDHFPRVEATMPGARGGSGLVLRLSDVQILSEKITAASGEVGLEQELLTAQESLAQLTADRDEAERQLAALGSLEERKLSAPLDVARARSNAELLTVRVEAQRARLALVQRRRARWSPTQEELLLSAARSEIESR